MHDIKQFLSEIFEENTEILYQLRGGMMNESFVVASKNKKYVLYVPTKQANEMVDRYLELENHDIVYKLGLTSKNVYFDVKTGIKVNRFIEGDSLNNLEEYDVESVANIIRTLHNSKVLSNSDYLPFERLEAFISDRKKVTNTVSPLHASLLSIVTKNRSYLEEDKKVICHNDFQKSNIVKDPDNNYYMIDFEFMGNNCAIYDIACFGNNSISDGVKLLKAYRNNCPTYDDYRKFYLWRVFISLQWYNVALIKHFRGEGEAHNINFLEVADHFINNAKEAADLAANIKR